MTARTSHARWRQAMGTNRHRVWWLRWSTFACTILVFALGGTADGSFLGKVSNSSDVFSTGTLQLDGTTSGGNCYSTGSGSGGTVASSNTATCVGTGSPLPTSLSTSAGSASTTLSSMGNVNATSAVAGSTGCGVASFSDLASATDWYGSGPNTAMAVGGVAYQATGPFSGSSAATFDGSSGLLETTVSYNSPGFSSPSTGLSVLAWFKTSSASGVLAGFSSSENPLQTTPYAYDRQLFVDPGGDLVWGEYTTSVQEAVSAVAVNTGSWVFAAVTVGSGGTDLYVNGSLTDGGTNTSISAQTGVVGYWTIGAGYTSGWPNAPSSNYFNGSVAQVALVPGVLTSTQISALYSDSSSLSTYESAVEAVSPAAYWPLDDTGSTYYSGEVPGAMPVADSSGNANTGTAEGTLAFQSAGPTTLGGYALKFDGVTGWVQTTTSYSNPENFSIVGWFKTTASGVSTGGGLMGFSDLQASTANSLYDRNLWMTTSGTIKWGVYNGGNQVLTSTSSYNNAQWHFVVAEIGTSGQQLWLDGAEVASSSSITSAESYTGWWHIDWAKMTNWDATVTSWNFPGSLSQWAVVPSQLSSSTISTLYAEASAANYESAVSALSPTAYWEMQGSATSVCSTVEATVEQDVGTTYTCLYPSQSGACPAPSPSYLVAGVGSRSLTTVPVSGTSVVIKISLQLSTTPASVLNGLDILTEVYFRLVRSSWKAGLDYSASYSTL